VRTLAAVLVETGKPLVLAELDMPPLQPGQVLVEVAYSGVCHTQVLECRGFRGEDRYLPHCLGHEGSGIVCEVGPGVTKVKPGDRVILSWIKGSGADLELSNMKYSIPSDLALIDSNGDGAVDRIYVGDTRGQLFRIDLGNQIDPGAGSASQRNGGSNGYVLADIGCTGGVRSNDCSATTKQDRRGFFYPPDIVQLRDAVYSTTETYDYITIATGDREDPLDKKTTSLSAEAVHNRIYAFRDYNVKVGPPTTIPGAFTESGMYDATANVLSNPSGGGFAAALTAFKGSYGWYLDLRESATPLWIGEKSLARTSVFAGILYVTTYTPATTAAATPCGAAAIGTAKLYGLDLLNGVGRLTSGARSETVGSGIPSHVVTVFTPGGPIGLVTATGFSSRKLEGETKPKPTSWRQGDCSGNSGTECNF